jgi:DNA helicase-2/ATP-dependent DNA helicase PcrA
VRNILEFPQRMPGCKMVKLTTNYRSHRASSSATTAGWLRPTGRTRTWPILPLRQDDQSRASGEASGVSGGLRHLGRNRRDEAARFADLVALLKQNAVIEDYSQVALLLHSVRQEHSGPTSLPSPARHPGLLPPRPCVLREPGGPRPCRLLRRIFGWYGNGRGEVAGAVAELATYVDDAIVHLARRFAAPHPLAAALQTLDGEIAALQKGSARCSPSRLPLPAARFRALQDSGVKNENAARNLAIFSQLLNAFQSYYHYTVVTHRNREILRLHLFNSFLRLLYDGGINEYEDPDQPFPKGHVQVMTIHQAKGLEFPVVVVGSLCDAAFEPQADRPGPRSLLPPADLRAGKPDHHFSTECACTTWPFSRAQKLLVLTAHETPKDHFAPIWQGLPQWPYVQKELLAAQRFRLRERMPVKKTYSFTGDLKIYETCPRQYQFFREYDFTPSRSAVIFFGLLVHQTIEEIHRIALDGRLDTLDEPRIRELFERTFRFLCA